MKKLFLLLAVAGLFVACGSEDKKDEKKGAEGVKAGIVDAFNAEDEEAFEAALEDFETLSEEDQEAIMEALSEENPELVDMLMSYFEEAYDEYDEYDEYEDYEDYDLEDLEADLEDLEDYAEMAYDAAEMAYDAYELAEELEAMDYDDVDLSDFGF